MIDWTSIPTVSEWRAATATAQAQASRKLDLSLFERIVRRWDVIQTTLAQPAASTSTAPPPINLEDSHGRIQLYALAAFRELIEQWLQEVDPDISEKYQRAYEAKLGAIAATSSAGQLLLKIGENAQQKAQVVSIAKKFKLMIFRGPKKANESNQAEALAATNAEIEILALVYNLVHLIDVQLFNILKISPEEQQSANLKSILTNKLELTISEHGLGTDAEHSSAYQASPEQIKNRMVIIKDKLLYQKKWYAPVAEQSTSSADSSQLALLDTEHIYAAESHNDCEDYYYGFAMNANYEIFASNQQRQYSEEKHHIIAFHASYTRGLPVLCAGNIAVRRGKLMIVSADSGHYQPTPDRLLLFLQYLNLKGVDLTGTWVTWCNEYPKDKFRKEHTPTKLLITREEFEEYNQQPTKELKQKVADELYKRTNERKRDFSRKIRAQLLFDTNTGLTTTVPTNIILYQCEDNSIIYRRNGNRDYPAGKTPKLQVAGSFYDEDQVYYQHDILDVDVEIMQVPSDQRWCRADKFISAANDVHKKEFGIANDVAEMNGVPGDILGWSKRTLENLPQ